MSSNLYSKVGSPYYRAPEIVNSKGYNEKCDIWSLGVILYVMLAGYPPFYTENPDDSIGLDMKIKEGKFCFPSNEWNKISNQAKLLILDMLKLDPQQRPTAEEILNYEWFDIFELNSGKPTETLNFNNNDVYSMYNKQKSEGNGMIIEN